MPYDPDLPMDPSVQLTTLDIADNMLPEKPSALDTPPNYSGLSDSINAQISAGTASPGAAAGGGLIAVLIVAAVDAGIDADRNGRLREYLTAQGFDGPAEFKTALLNELTALGYEVSFTEIEQNRRKQLDTYEGSGQPGSAMLEIYLDSYGFVQLMPGASWTPNAFAAVDITAPDGTILLDTNIGYASTPAAIYGVYPQYMSTTKWVPGRHAYQFTGINQMVDERPDEGVAALRFAMNSLAQGIAELVADASPAARDAMPSDSATALIDD